MTAIATPIPATVPTTTRFAATVDNADLKKALALVKPAVASRGGALPVLRGVHFEARDGAVWLTASDLDLTIQTHIPAQVEREGAFVLAHSLIAGQTKSAGTCRFEDIGDDEVAYQSTLKGRLRTLPVDEFPRRPELYTGDGQLLDLATIKRILPSVSSDESLPVISGVFFDGDRAASTDRYRLHVGTTPGAGYPKILVPGRALKHVAKFGKPTVMVVAGDERTVQFVSERVVFTSRLIEGEFPPYEKLIPDGYPHQVTLPKAKVVEAIDHLKPLITDSITPVRLELVGARATLQVVSRDHGTASVDLDLAEAASGEMAIGLNPAFLRDCLTAGSGADDVVVEYLDPMKPIVIRDTDELYPGPGVLRLLMPVRLTN